MKFEPINPAPPVIRMLCNFLISTIISLCVVFGKPLHQIVENGISISKTFSFPSRGMVSFTAAS